MKKNSKFYLIELIILIFIIIYKILINRVSGFYVNLINVAFWFLTTIILLMVGGFPRDRNYYKKSSIKIIIIISLFYILIIYLLGLFLGFIKNLYFLDFLMLFKKVFVISLFIIGSEMTRYLFLKHNPSKLQICLFTIELIILNIIMGINSYDISDPKKLFIVTSITIVPIIASEIMYSYLSYNVGFLTTIICKLIFSLYTYIVPFTPDLGDYLQSVFGIVIPFIIYKEVKNNLRYSEKYSLHAKKTVLTVSSTILLSFLGVMVILVSGVFKYQMIAIATGSMEPVYYRGDAVIIEKVDPDSINVGDILVYKASGGIITHRVVEILEKNGEKVFHTKGDNNSTEDNVDITADNVKGTVKYVVKYAGYLTIIFNELLESK